MLHPSEDPPSQVRRFLRFRHPSLAFHGEVSFSASKSSVNMFVDPAHIFEQMVSGLLHLSSQFLLMFPRVSFRLEFHSWLSLTGSTFGK